MLSTRITAVTGAADFWGRWMAERLAASGLPVLAIDRQPPATPLTGIEFIEVELQNPLLADLLKTHGVRRILHLDFTWERRATPAGYERNVVASQRLMDAAVEARVEHIVWLGSTLGYGARSDNPAFIAESAALRGGKAGYARQLAEIDEMFTDLRSRPHAPLVTVLRAANIVGAEAPSPMNELLKLWAAPTLLGFDPMMQLVHEEDVAAALEHALRGDDFARPFDGAVNIAAYPPAPLARILHAAGVMPIPLFHPFAYAAKRLGPLANTTEKNQPFEWDMLRYPIVGDTSLMTSEFGFTPRYDTDAILAPLAERGERRRAALRLRRGRGEAGTESEAAAPEETPNA